MPVNSSEELDSWLERIQQLHPVAWDLGLDRVGAVGKKMGLLKPARNVILVAGTNGKGSCCEYLASLCAEKGLSHGKTTSPFFIKYNEQFIVDGIPVSDQEIVDALALIDTARGDISLSYFEFGALAALQIFKRRQVDVAILEIGLGGRLDAMNIVDPDVSIITKIALDHEEWLGTDLDTIAIEKAGVMRKGKPVVTVDPTPPESLGQEITRQQAVPLRLGTEFTFNDFQLDFDDIKRDLSGGHLPEYSLLAAVMAMAALGFMPSQAELNKVIAETRLMGRFQIIDGSPQVILDVAHNPNAAERLASKLAEAGISGLQAVVAVYADKDIPQVFQHLAPFISNWHFPQLAQPRAATVEQLNAHLINCCGSTGQSYATVAEAFEAAKSNCNDGESLLVFGSFPIVAGVLKHLGKSAYPM